MVALEWSQEIRRAIQFHTAHREGQTVAIVRESLKGVSFQCLGLDRASLFSSRYQNAHDIETAKTLCEIHVRKVPEKPVTERRGSLIGRALQQDRKTYAETEFWD